MKTYEIEVTEINYYKKTFQIRAESEEAAKENAKQMVFEDPLDDQKDTYQTTEMEIVVKPKLLKVHTVESLFNVDKQECDDEVIRLEDLTDDQKEYLGLQ